MSAASGEASVTVNSRKYDGTVSRTWTAEILEFSDSLLVLRGEFDRDVRHDDLGLIRKGTVSIEYFPIGKWFSVFQFHEADSRFRNFYCNINMPPKFAGGALDYVDLDIDVVIWPDGRQEILDRDEFEKNAALLAYPEDVIKNAEAALADLLRSIEKGEFPFDRTDRHLG